MFRDTENRFDGLPITTEYIDGRMWRLDKNVAYTIYGVGKLAGMVTTVREGFVFDWASIPRPLWRLLPPAGDHNQPYGMAALFHDWLYVHQSIDSRPCSRRDADRVFLEIMRYVGVSWLRAHLMYWAVRVGGWRGWRNGRKKPQNGPQLVQGYQGTRTGGIARMQWVCNALKSMSEGWGSRNLVPLVNNSPDLSDSVDLAAMPNALPDSDQDAPKRLRIPYGDTTYNRDGVSGIQRLNREIADRMVNLWNALAKKTRYSRGRPIYEGGHPDYRPDPNGNEPAGVGRVREMVATDTALELVVEWGETGLKALANKAWAFFSPYFLGRPIGKEAGQTIYEPVHLKSVGLTNNPNMDVEPLINNRAEHAQNAKGGNMELLQRLIALIGRNDIKDEEGVLSYLKRQLGAANSIRDAAKNATLIADETARVSLTNAQDGDTLASEFVRLVNDRVTNLANSLSAKETKVTELESELMTARTERDAHKKARAEALVNSAIEAGRIEKGKKDDWMQSLVNATDFDAQAGMLGSLKQAVPAGGKGAAGDVAGRKDEARVNQNKAIELVNAKMENGKLSYDDAFSAVRSENPELFGEKSANGEGGE